MGSFLATDFVLDRPTGPGGWLLIAVVLVFSASIIARGMVSFSTSVRDRLNLPLYFLLALGIAYLISQLVSTDPAEPLVNQGVDVFPATPVDGTVDPNHSHETVGHSHDPAG